MLLFLWLAANMMKYKDESWPIARNSELAESESVSDLGVLLLLKSCSNVYTNAPENAPIAQGNQTLGLLVKLQGFLPFRSFWIDSCPQTTIFTH
jgi:hypothetical protein